MVPDTVSAVVLQAQAMATLTMAGLVPLAVIAWLGGAIRAANRNAWHAMATRICALWT